MVFMGFDVIFAACGGLLMGFSLISEQTMRGSPTLDNVARRLLLDQCPLTGTIIPSWGENGSLQYCHGTTVAASVLRLQNEAGH